MSKIYRFATPLILPNGKKVEGPVFIDKDDPENELQNLVKAHAEKEAPKEKITKSKSKE